MSGEAPTLLVVDDNEENRDLLGRRLEKAGFTVLLAESGPEALSAVASGPVDLVLLDVMMPGMSGTEVLEQLRRTHAPSELPIIMVTACTDAGDVVAALDRGANDYVTKPVDMPILLARVQAQLRARAGGAAARRPGRGAVGSGSVLDERYRLDARIGSGSFGTVYRAEHLRLRHPVAVKLLQAQARATPQALARFQSEGISACRLQHPNAVAVLDFGISPEGIPYLVMELLQGRPLSEEMAAGPLGLRRGLEVARPVCSVLAEAHRVGIVHRDVKPANVFLHQGPLGEVVKVLDFGIAKLVGEAALEGQATAAGMILGTPAYMAPERLRGAAYDGRSDIYSLGTVLYEMLSGRLPFLARTRNPLEMASLKLSAEPERLGRLVPSLPPEIEEAVMRALAREPAERPTAESLGRTLDRGAGVEVPDGPVLASGDAVAPVPEGAAPGARAQEPETREIPAGETPTEAFSPEKG